MPMPKNDFEVSVEVETNLYVTINGLRRKLTREKAEKLANSLNAALGKSPRSPVLPEGNDDEGGMKYGPFSVQDVEFLRSGLKMGRPIENVALTLKRTAASCRKKAEELGLEVGR